MAINTPQIENSVFRVTRWELEPGDSIPEHRHEHDYVVVPLTGGTLSAVTPDGSETAVELSIGQSYARPARAVHTIENRGSAAIVFIEIEALFNSPVPA